MTVGTYGLKNSKYSCDEMCKYFRTGSERQKEVVRLILQTNKGLKAIEKMDLSIRKVNGIEELYQQEVNYRSSKHVIERNIIEKYFGVEEAKEFNKYLRY